MLESSGTMPPPEYSLVPSGLPGGLAGPYYVRITDAEYALLINVAPAELNQSGAAPVGMLLNIASIAHAGASQAQSGGTMLRAISLHSDFMGMAGPGWLEATAWVTHKTREMIRTHGEIRLQGELIMTCSGIYEILAAK